MPRSLRVATSVATLLLPGLLAVPASAVTADPGTPSEHPSTPVAVLGWSEAPAMAPARATYGVRLRVSGGPRAVRLERRLGDRWRPVAWARTDDEGQVALRWRTPPRRTHVALRIVVPGTDARPVATTPTRVVTIRRRSAWDGLSPTLKRVHALVNEARTSGQTCGTTYVAPVRPVRINLRLTRAASGFADEMATQDFMAHTSLDGTTAGERIDAAGYLWRSYGENVAGGHHSADQVVQGWLDSPGHCENLMGDFTEMGLGYAVNPAATYQRYWVQDLATR